MAYFLKRLLIVSEGFTVYNSPVIYIQINTDPPIEDVEIEKRRSILHNWFNIQLS